LPRPRRRGSSRYGATTRSKRAFLGVSGGRLVSAQFEDEDGPLALGAAFAIDRGGFEFLPQERVDRQDLSGELEEQLERALVERERVAGIRDVIPNDRMWFRLSQRATERGEITLASQQWRALLLVDGQRDVIAIARELGMPRLSAQQLLAALVRAGLIDALPPPEGIVPADETAPRGYRRLPPMQPIPPTLSGERVVLHGRLPDFPLETVLQLLAETKKTGRLEVRAAPERSTLGVDEGRLVSARTGEEEGELGLGAAFTAHEGEFDFVPMTEAPAANLSGDLDPLLDRAADIRDRIVAIRGVVPNERARLQLSERAVARSEIVLTPEQWRVLLGVNGERDVAQIADHLHMRRLPAMMALAELVRGGYVDVVSELTWPVIERRRSPWPAAPEPAAPLTPVAEEVVPTEPAPPEPAPSPWAVAPPAIEEGPPAIEVEPVIEEPVAEAPVAEEAVTEEPVAEAEAAAVEEPEPAPPPPAWQTPSPEAEAAAATAEAFAAAPPEPEIDPRLAAFSAPAPAEPEAPAPTWEPMRGESPPQTPPAWEAPSWERPAPVEEAPAEVDPRLAAFGAPPVGPEAPSREAPAAPAWEPMKGEAPPQAPPWEPFTEAATRQAPPEELAQEPAPPVEAEAAPAEPAVEWPERGRGRQIDLPPPPVAPAPVEKRKGGLFGGLFGGGAKAAPVVPRPFERAGTRAWQLASFANELVAAYNSGAYGKARVEDRMLSLLMRADEQADPIDRPLPIANDRLDVGAIDRSVLPDRQAVPYLATLLRQIFDDAERALGKDKARRGFRDVRERLFGKDLTLLQAPEVGRRLTKV